ncbi:sensor histidine kinase [Clostridium grantii]|uniref:Histidine kinase-, DNA gyrase B-, and HSP90-like ATPase n=1 Tax=Clostridium grantii DSM 8605 TaxID=1121316 RepID=A0A1M5TLM9_9CLOT|nr:ATP-binding protein [Clostridium grantii]SHH51579.1 Histidine kinase-, DNA gyrase B-, and HSP90-like ATPase [Clostridium grantii DSM 8605]
MDKSSIIYKLVVFPTEALCVLVIYLLLAKRKVKNYKDIIRIIVYVIMSSLFAIWIREEVTFGYHTIFIVVFSSMLTSILYTSKLWVAFISNIISTIYLLAFELIILIIATKVLGINMLDKTIMEKSGVTVFIIIRGMEFIGLGIIFKLRHKLKGFASIDVEDNTLVYNALGVFFIAILILNLQTKSAKYGEIYGTNMLIYVVFVGFILINILDYRKKIELMNIKNKYEVREDYIENLQTVVDIVRKEKHDFANIINTVYAQSVLNKEDSIEKIRTYLKSTINSLDKINIFYDTGNTYVDGLLAVKSNNISKNNIHLDVDFEISLEFLEFSDNDFIAVLSNILDNGMNALNEIETEDTKVISLYSYEEEGNYYLAISNNGPAIPKEKINKIFEKGYSSRKYNKDDHGYGLFIVKNLILKNGGDITVTSDKESTEFLLKLKLSKNYKENYNEYAYIPLNILKEGSFEK